MRTVGILGGMGPEATILLMQKVLQAVPAQDDADHVPLIVHQNPAVPSRIKALIEGTGPSPGPCLSAMAQDLERAGAQALAMPCNTAHHYVSDIQSSVVFINMIELTIQELKSKGVVGLICSPAVQQTKIFEGRGVNFVYPADGKAVLKMIQDIKKGDLDQGLAAVCRSMQCDHICIACTELSLLTPTLPSDIAWTDSIDCLVKGIVEFAKSDGGSVAT